MKKEDEVIKALKLLHKCKPHTVFEEVEKHEAGYFAVLKYLCEKDTEASSKEIANYIGVSSARMTILIKKLDGKRIYRKES